MSKPIKIVATPVESIPIELVGKNYVVTPPKSIHALQIAKKAQGATDDPEVLTDVLTGWVKSAFTKKDATAIQKRLDDPADLLDITHLTELVSAIIEHQTQGRPTT